MYHPALRPAPLALAIALALCSTTLCAQDVQGGVAAVTAIEFNIAAKPLGEALGDWALQARRQIIVRPELARGKTAPAVSGTLAPAEALGRLLAGSGLAARLEGEAVVIVDAASATTSGALPVVTVNAQADASASTENSGTYAARAVTLFKGQTSLREIPQSVSVLTRQQIDDQNLVAVEDAINKMTGARISDFQRSEAVYVRGYTISKQVDGAPMQSAGVGVDMALYDRIELLRGPSGLLTGTGNPGGVMNFVLKRPQADYAFNAAATVGSASNKRGEVDVTGPLTKDGALRGRLVVVGQDKDGFTSYGDERKQLVYGALEYVFSPDTKVGLSYYYQRYQYYNSYGVPLDSNGQVVARGSYVGPDRLSTQTDSRTTVDLTHKLGAGWETHAVYSHANNRFEGYSAYTSNAVSTSTGLANYSLTHANNTYSWDGADVYVSGPVRLFERDHVVTLGYSYSRYEGDTASKTVTGASKDVLDDHNYDALIGSAGLDNLNTAHTQTITAQSGIYASSRIRLADPLTLVLGARWTDYSSKTRSVGATAGNWTTSAAAATDRFSPYGGLVWDVNRNLSFYGSYADIFVPQTTQDYQGNVLAPRVGWQGEVGAKTEWFDGALNATLAFYRIRDTNRSMVDPDHVGCGGTTGGTCYRAAGLVQSQGWEFEMTGKPSPRWDITTGYTYNQATYLRDTTASNVGAIFAWPRHLFKLWTQYRPGADGGVASTWTLGAGMNAQSEIVNGTVRQGGYATFNARVGYRIDKNWDLSLNLNNLTDRSYLRTVGYTGYYNSWGDPRNVQLIARAHF
ncbi:TonB-dependent siderophore receptor [Herbaspirillum sp. YR522]|uniref:TonB-dependent siderophore receptor n=1 Tax=Herbaspirillum sp. YR522 TaxID=1144342 RepID=UPI00026FBC15|nr:TonB-dependent siderophore receptor [Herbaspirillum sp. YR522]EJN07751.1 TonB-dependent siderophore receptor [Herbaspirillum sp. YR522]